MEKFVPREKMNKKDRRVLDQQKRREWDVKPTMKIMPNKKKEQQNRKPRPGREDSGWGVFLYMAI